jgi:hypothetical protein
MQIKKKNVAGMLSREQKNGQMTVKYLEMLQSIFGSTASAACICMS